MMNSRFPVILAFFFCLFLTAGSGIAAAEGDFGSKISIENHMEERLKNAISEITGSDKVIVAVNADVDTSRARGGSSGAARRGVLKQKDDSANALVLPGVPAKKEIGKSQTQTAELNIGDAPQISGSVLIRRLAVTILLDKGVPAAMVDVVRDVAMNVTDFSQSRGDRLDIKQIDIKKTRFSWSAFLYPPHLYWLILIVTGAFFLLAASLFLMNPYIKLSGSGQNVKVDVLKDVAAGVLGKGGEAESEGAGPESGVSGEAEYADKSTLPFSFVRERHLRDLSYLMKKESPQDIAVIVNYLDSDLAVKFMDSFPADRQAEIAVRLTDIAEITPEKIRELEEKIKERLGYIIGGEDKVANILDLVADDVRDKVFSLVESRDAEAAKRLKQKVKDLETFMREIPTQGLQAIYRQMDHALFAQILKSMPVDIQARVTESLSAGGAELLKQEMDLSRPLPAARMKKERHNMMLIIRRMIREGSLEVGN